MRGFRSSSESPLPWRQFGVGLLAMLPWPILAAVIQGLKDPVDYLIYLIGMFWSLLWDPVAKIQELLPARLENPFTYALLAILVLTWFTVAALPLFGRWPKKQVLGLWVLQASFAAAQALSGFVYVKLYLLPTL